MAWCQNPHCKKQGLNKKDVEFCEDTHMVLCVGCYALRHPGWLPPEEEVVVIKAVPGPHDPPKLNYEFHMTSRDGFTAQIGYGQMAVGFHAPMSELKRYFAPIERPKLS